MAKQTNGTARVDVVIVGAGPVGLTAAHLCHRAGLTAVVLEKRDGPQRAPAAHAINGRTFEIWRQAGLPMDTVLADALAPSESSTVYWVTKLGGEILGSLPYERQGDEWRTVTPHPLRNLSQHRLEPALQAPFLDVRYGHEVTDSVDHGDHVTASVTGPDGAPYLVSADWLLACDGAACPIRRRTGIELIGPRTIQSFVMIHIAADLTPVIGGQGGVLYFVADPASGGTFISHGLDREWVYMHTWHPDREPEELFTADHCRALVARAMAQPVEFEVLAHATWHMSAQVAERYRSGRIFLAGDAAHRFPPTGGLGLNSGAADVHNLVWKLAAVKAGWAPAAVLDTYESERRPVAHFNCDQSLRNAMRLIEVPIALGYTADPEHNAAELAATLADSDRRARVAAAIADQATHFDLFGLQLGHSYRGPLVVDDGTAPVPVEDPARDYVPSTRPGGRLPHAWLDDGRSTLDLVDARVPTVLVRAGAPAPDCGAQVPVLGVACPGGAWDDVFGLDAGSALVVRPDQHIAYRGPLDGIAPALAALFPTG